MSKKLNKEYQGFEQGPIRPPSEADSLLIRVTRNCPWNFCTFCPVYKGRKFSLRPKEHVILDIKMVHKYVKMLKQRIGSQGTIAPMVVQDVSNMVLPSEADAFYAALHWFAGGLESVFIQDANSLIIKPDDLIEILTCLRKCFPWIKRITSYARSHTIARISDQDLASIKNAGLNRIHIGLESGSDQVLKIVRKGSDKAMHIKAGQKVKKAGMELSEYVMPGLGGQALSEIHAIETADALNQINPDFIRLRTLAIPNRIPLYKDYQSGAFEKCSDLMTAKEIRLFIHKLDGITSTIKSDHILNLFQEIEGKLPQDKPKLLNILDSFLNMNPEKQCIYQAGRRLGIFHSMEDMDSPQKRKKAEIICKENNINTETVDRVIEDTMKRFI
ncbi:Radical SAM domain-containing protein [Desulfonema limicola]|uniref:Radical SAM domain-containing protein n=1 Tax=Desulfonema limicola TaxID=45656 RepID=A0A975B344_9BACT|nr:Radical SAM domain-containing protein [Desulfonema limicola]